MLRESVYTVNRAAEKAFPGVLKGSAVIHQKRDMQAIQTEKEQNKKADCSAFCMYSFI